MDKKQTLENVIQDNAGELETMKVLQLKLARTIDGSNSGRDIAALSRQLREVTEKISELEAQTEVDEIEEILNNRAPGLPGAIRNEKRQVIYEYEQN